MSYFDAGDVMRGDDETGERVSGVGPPSVPRTKCIHGVEGCTMGNWSHAHIGGETRRHSWTATAKGFSCPYCGKEFGKSMGAAIAHVCPQHPSRRVDPHSQSLPGRLTLTVRGHA